MQNIVRKQWIAKGIIITEQYSEKLWFMELIKKYKIENFTYHYEDEEDTLMTIIDNLEYKNYFKELYKHKGKIRIAKAYVLIYREDIKRNHIKCSKNMEFYEDEEKKYNEHILDDLINGYDDEGII
ncbi:uncharacterized protein PMUG01_04031100 [Plasmodium malariae]|uniref:STP1 protein n=1 Tax=Plasmodium malariae TaxID=5858 RepID=A0A1D3JJG3_PLAMA|nr:uncharacterized protein PMUG01_04031100 [Plasmodium malariae]SBT86615.1 hypothetical protein PMUG01_04031100 [Plasmodium malariae]